MTKKTTTKMLREAREFIDDCSPDWYFPKQRMLNKIDAALTAYEAARQKVPKKVGVYRVQMKPYPTRVDVAKNPAFWAAHDAAKAPPSAPFAAAPQKPAPDAEMLIKNARELAKHYDGCDEDAAKAKFLRDLADALTAAAPQKPAPDAEGLVSRLRGLYFHLGETRECDTLDRATVKDAADALTAAILRAETIRAETVEACAKVADGLADADNYIGCNPDNAPRYVAAKIRALSPTAPMLKGE